MTDYQPPDIKHTLHVLRITALLGNGAGEDVIVARPVGPPTGPLDGIVPGEPVPTELARVALAREVPRIIDELARAEGEVEQLVKLLREMITGRFRLSSERFRDANDPPGELGEHRRQALMMYTSVTRGQASRKRTRGELKARGELSQ